MTEWKRVMNKKTMKRFIATMLCLSMLLGNVIFSHAEDLAASDAVVTEAGAQEETADAADDAAEQKPAVVADDVETETEDSAPASTDQKQEVSEETVSQTEETQEDIPQTVEDKAVMETAEEEKVVIARANTNTLGRSYYVFEHPLSLEDVEMEFLTDDGEVVPEGAYDLYWTQNSNWSFEDIPESDLFQNPLVASSREYYIWAKAKEESDYSGAACGRIYVCDVYELNSHNVILRHNGKDMGGNLITAGESFRPEEITISSWIDGREYRVPQSEYEIAGYVSGFNYIDYNNLNPSSILEGMPSEEGTYTLILKAKEESRYSGYTGAEFRIVGENDLGYFSWNYRSYISQSTAEDERVLETLNIRPRNEEYVDYSMYGIYDFLGYVTSYRDEDSVNESELVTTCSTEPGNYYAVLKGITGTDGVEYTGYKYLSFTVCPVVELSLGVSTSSDPDSRVTKCYRYIVEKDGAYLIQTTGNSSGGLYINNQSEYINGSSDGSRRVKTLSAGDVVELYGSSKDSVQISVADLYDISSAMGYIGNVKYNSEDQVYPRGYLYFSDDGPSLSYGKDYRVSHYVKAGKGGKYSPVETFDEPGDYGVVYKGIGNYHGEKTVYFTIYSPYDLSEMNVSFGYGYTYLEEGETWVPKLVVNNDYGVGDDDYDYTEDYDEYDDVVYQQEVLTLNTDYSIVSIESRETGEDCSAITEEGEYKVTIKGMGAYKGTRSLYVYVESYNSRDLSEYSTCLETDCVTPGSTEEDLGFKVFYDPYDEIEEPDEEDCISPENYELEFCRFLSDAGDVEEEMPDYEIMDGFPTNPGSYGVRAVGVGNYTGTTYWRHFVMLQLPETTEAVTATVGTAVDLPNLSDGYYVKFTAEETGEYRLKVMRTAGVSGQVESEYYYDYIVYQADPETQRLEEFDDYYRWDGEYYFTAEAGRTYWVYIKCDTEDKTQVCINKYDESHYYEIRGEFPRTNGCTEQLLLGLDESAILQLSVYEHSDEIHETNPDGREITLGNVRIGWSLEGSEYSPDNLSCEAVEGNGAELRLTGLAEGDTWLNIWVEGVDANLSGRIYGEFYVSVSNEFYDFSINESSEDLYKMYPGDTLILTPELRFISTESEEWEQVSSDQYSVSWKFQKQNVSGTKRYAAYKGNKIVADENGVVTITEDTEGFYRLRVTVENTLTDQIIKDAYYYVYISENTEGHHWDEGVVVNPPTCNTDGYCTYTCTDEGCGETKDETLYALGHDLIKTEGFDATCTTEGCEAYWTCQRCGEIYADENAETETTVEECKIPQLEHTWNEWYQSLAPTLTTEGEETRGCVNCDAVETRSLPKSQLSISLNKESLSMSVFDEETLVATVLPVVWNGPIEWESYDETIATVEDGVVTAKSAGITTIKATVAAGPDNIAYTTCLVNVSSHEHTWGEGMVSVPPTCTETGIMKYYCTDERCTEMKEEVTPVLGHALKKTDKVDAACIMDGCEAYWTCERCEKLFADENAETETTVEACRIAALDHDFRLIEGRVEPTCKTAGKEAIEKCSRCEVTRGGEVIAALGHDIKVVSGKSASCTDTGKKEHYQCDRCKELYADAAGKTVITDENALVIPMQPHQWSEWYQSLAPTLTTEGEETRGCVNCDAVETRILPKYQLSISLDKESLSMSVDDEDILVATVLPVAWDGLIEWSSSDETIATVVDGVVTARGDGLTEIKATVTAGDGNIVSATCLVHVSAQEPAALYDIGEADVTRGISVEYDPEDQQYPIPSLRIRRGKSLTYGKDYRIKNYVKYNVDKEPSAIESIDGPGNYGIVCRGIGKYTGEITVPFIVYSPYDFSRLPLGFKDVRLSDDEVWIPQLRVTTFANVRDDYREYHKYHEGFAFTPKELLLGTDYEIVSITDTYGSGDVVDTITEPGNYSVTVRGLNEYEGTNNVQLLVYDAYDLSSYSRWMDSKVLIVGETEENLGFRICYLSEDDSDREPEEEEFLSPSNYTLEYCRIEGTDYEDAFDEMISETFTEFPYEAGVYGVRAVGTGKYKNHTYWSGFNIVDLHDVEQFSQIAEESPVDLTDVTNGQYIKFVPEETGEYKINLRKERGEEPDEEHVTERDEEYDEEYEEEYDEGYTSFSDYQLFLVNRATGKVDCFSDYDTDTGAYYLSAEAGETYWIYIKGEKKEKIKVSIARYDSTQWYELRPESVKAYQDQNWITKVGIGETAEVKLALYEHSDATYEEYPDGKPISLEGASVEWQISDENTGSIDVLQDEEDPTKATVTGLEEGFAEYCVTVKIGDDEYMEWLGFDVEEESYRLTTRETEFVHDFGLDSGMTMTLTPILQYTNAEKADWETLSAERCEFSWKIEKQNKTGVRQFSTYKGDKITVGDDDAITFAENIPGLYRLIITAVDKETERLIEKHYFVDIVDVESTHNWDKGSVVKEPTCTEDGLRKYTCTDEGCAETFEESIEALGHDLTETDKVDPTCTTDGCETYWRCDRCKKVYANESAETETTVEACKIASLGHNYQPKDAKVEPTCTVEGKEATEECSRCHDVKGGEVISALGHDYQVKNEKADPTCEEAGKEAVKECSRCHDEIGGETIPALDHTLTKTEKVEATCTADGNEAYWKCGRCEKVYADENAELETTVEACKIAATGHDYRPKDAKVDPTCTKAGVEATEECSRCHDVIGGEVIAALGHNIINIGKQPASCMNTGTKDHYQCERCKELYADASGKTVITDEKILVIPMQSHKWEWLADRIVDETTTIRTRVCQADGCGATESQTVKTDIVISLENKTEEEKAEAVQKITDAVKKVADSDESGTLAVVEDKTTATTTEEKKVTVSKEVLEAVKNVNDDAEEGKKVDLVVEVKLEDENENNSYTWTIDGASIGEETDLTDIDLTVNKLKDEQVAPEVKAAVEKIADPQTTDLACQLVLSHEGTFNANAKLRIYINAEKAGEIAYLYWLQENGEIECVDSCVISEDGYAEFSYEHASDYFVLTSDTDTEESWSITLSDTNAAMTEGDSRVLKCSTVPGNFKPASIAFASSNPAVAKVDDGGRVTAVKPGTATITATAVSQLGTEKTVTCTVTVNAKIYKVSGIAVTSEYGAATSVAAGKGVQLSATVTPANATNNAITWESSNPKLVTVNASGYAVVNKKATGGSAFVYAKAADGSGVQGAIKISIKKAAVKSISISGKKTVKPGKTLKLKATVKATKKGSINKKLVWTSSNPSIATVTSSGKVKTFKGKKGKVKITVSATDGSKKKKSITITVK